MRFSYNTTIIALGSFLIIVIGFGIYVLLSLWNSPFATHYPLLFFIPIAILLLMAKFYIPMIYAFWKGEKGEEKVHKMLVDHLPSSYYCLHDVTLGNTGNIDEVVISPVGIWTIEVKNGKGGEITLKNGLLCKNGYPLEGKNLKEAYHESLELQDFIRQSLGLYLPVSPILVFANPRYRMKFGFQGVNGVQVIGINWLIKLLEEQNMPILLTSEQCVLVRDEIKKYTSVI